MKSVLVAHMFVKLNHTFFLMNQNQSNDCYEIKKKALNSFIYVILMENK